MKQVQNCFERNLKLCTFENVASVLAVLYVLLGRAVTEYRWGGSRNLTFMRHKFLVLTVKKWLKSVYIYGSYREIKTGVSLLDHSVYFQKLESSAYIFVAARMGLSSFNFVQWPPKDASFLLQSAFWPFKVIQGRWFWYQSKARMRLPISPPLWLWCYLAPFLR